LTPPVAERSHPSTLRTALLALACGTAAALVVVGAPAHAEPAAAVEDEPPPTLIRIALSKRAAETISEVRVRRLVGLQVGGDLQVAPEPYGPLDENVVRVFIDLPSPTIAAIQAVAPKRRITVRRVDVAGLPWDAATRFVAIAAIEAIRLQARPQPRRKPRPPTAAEIAERQAKTPSLEMGGALTGAWLSDDGSGLLGSRLRFTFHQRVLSEHLGFSALGSTSGAEWLEGSVGVGHRTFWLPDVRTMVGVGAAAAGVFAEGASGDADPWLRAYASLGVGIRVVGDAWLSVDVEPGLAVDAKNESPAAWLGASMAISYDGAVE